MLPDMLAENLRVIFCGTAASRASAARGHYYAGPGNSFWKTLHRVGLTPVELRSEQDARVLDYGIGLTDIAKGVSGMDREIPSSAYAPARLRAIAVRYAPRVLAFTGKNAARHALGKAAIVEYGPLGVAGLCPLWVLPSTSGAARGHYSIKPWAELARFVLG